MTTNSDAHARRSSVRPPSSHAPSVTTTSPCSPRSVVTATLCITTKLRPRHPDSGRSWSRAVITSAILNAVVAEELPGPGTVFLNANWEFKAPVRPGDTITGRVEVISVRTDKPITELRTTVTRDDGTVVLDGTAVCYTMDMTTGNAQ